jgi:murein DD-endopeptidase MepM/ murein hydrolase activator NlpD
MCPRSRTAFSWSPAVCDVPAPLLLLILPLILLFCCPWPAVGESGYPQILSLNRDDPLFRQAMADIDDYYRLSAAGDAPPPFGIFSYRPAEEDTLFSLASRCNLPYESIALLNSFSGPQDIEEGKELLIPNTPGIFVPLQPRTDLEKLMVSWRQEADKKGEQIVIRSPKFGRRSLFFLSGERFHPVERAFFLQVLFRFPLPDGIISSPYGPRRSPFTDTVHFHHGIDIAAPTGTEVFASWKGEVTSIGFNTVLGRYVVISHSNGFRTIYGHLEKILVKGGTTVGTGTIIGLVGNTGISTGPHLHFEIRKSGESWDPSEMIR